MEETQGAGLCRGGQRWECVLSGDGADRKHQAGHGFSVTEQILLNRVGLKRELPRFAEVTQNTFSEGQRPWKASDSSPELEACPGVTWGGGGWEEDFVLTEGKSQTAHKELGMAS